MKLTRWIKPLELSIVTCFISYTYIVFFINGTLDILGMISIESYRASIGRFYKRLRHFANARSVFSIRCKDVYHFHMFTIFAFVFARAIICFFCNICIGTIWCSLFEISESQAYNCFSHCLELNYAGLNP